MAKHVSARFENANVEIDGEEFEKCVFKNVTLVYSGGALPRMSECEFEDFRLMFAGPAQNTLNLLRALSGPRSGFRPWVEGTFKAILE